MIETFFNGNPIKKDFEEFIDTPYALPLIAYMRDIYFGRGEYYTSYMMLEMLLKHDRWDMFDKVFARFLYIPDAHPYGSYKDIKYFCEYIRNETNFLNKRYIYHHIIRKFVNPQLMKDKTSETPSLLAKWLPREKGKFGWLVKEIAWCNYNDNYDLASHALKEYRMDITEINRRLDTTQIHMANRTWSEIKEFRGETLRLQNRAFMSNKNEDREKCSINLSKRPPFLNKSLVTPNYLVQTCLEINDPLFNDEWIKMVKSYPECKKYIPAVDCIEGIGLALMVAEKAGIKQVYTGTIGVNIDMPFNDKVKRLKDAIATLKPDYLDDNFILFSKNSDITQYTHLNMVHWNVIGPNMLPIKEGNLTIISGNDPLMLKCLLKGELTFKTMLNDSRYKF